MRTNRLEAFSDGVVAILITIMVLELKTPEDATWAALRHVLPTVGLYLLSFVMVGIYWNNHHHMLHLVERVNGSILWANLHLMFWLSLIPFLTAWLGETHFAALPASLYGVVLLMCGFAWFLLQKAIIAEEGRESKLARALGTDVKAYVSLGSYALAIPLAFVSPWIAIALYAFVSVVWFVPDKRFERHAR